MNLAISPQVMEEIADFSKRWGVGEPVFSDYKLIIRVPIMSIVFFQPERYSKLIACYFDFGDEVGFFFEDVVSAVADVKVKSPAYSKSDIAVEEILRRNDAYVRDVLNFFAKDSARLTTLPPEWFKKAADISDAVVRIHFPDMADLDKKRKQALLERWGQGRCK